MMKSKAINATLWSAAETALRQGMQLVSSIILARLLSPKEFGTFAALSIFLAMASSIVDSGFSAALIRTQDATQADKSTVFWINLLVALLLAIALGSSATSISQFYGHPILVPITWAMALNLVLSALGATHGSILIMQLDFRSQMFASAGATALATILAIVMAWQGFGVWALVAQAIFATAGTTLSLWIMARWRPSFSFSKASALHLFAFGKYVFLAGMLEVVYGKLHTLIIGRFFGVRELGLYSRAEGTKSLPVGIIAGVFIKVLYPVFSAMQHDKAAFRLTVRRSIRVLLLMAAPMALGLAAVSKPFVIALFGRQWAEAVPVLQILCLSAVLLPQQVILTNAFLAQGDSKLVFKMDTKRKAIGLVMIGLGAFYGVLGIAVAQVMASMVGSAFNSVYARTHLGYSLREQGSDYASSVGIAAVMGICVYALVSTVQWDEWVALLVASAMGVVLYFVICRLLRVQALMDALDILVSRKRLAQ